MIEAFGTVFQNPILLAAGTAGFGRELSGVVSLDRLGGIVTKAVSPAPREGNRPPRVAEFRGGMLNSIGLANPGMEVVARDHLPWLAAHLERARVIVNVVGSTVDDYVAVVAFLDRQPRISAFELNVSCPNTTRGGEEFGADAEVLSDLVYRCTEATARPVLVKLAPTLPDIARTALVAEASGAAGISVVNTMPGMLYDDAVAKVPCLGAGQGGVSGPALLPVGVLATRRVASAVSVPVIGVGGIRSIEDVEQYLSSGATLVAIGTAALADPRCPERLARRWRRRG